MKQFWSNVLALSVIAILLMAGVPRKAKPSPHAGAARKALGAAVTPRPTRLPETRYERVIVLGIDGCDPDIMREVLAETPELVPNFKKLADEGGGVLDLGTSTPPQSPVAWSNFITGRNPGGHGVYDFIHRNPETYFFAPSTVTEGGEPWKLPGGWELPNPFAGGGESNRSGVAWWTLLGENGVPADVWRMPINFPVEPGRGVSFPGMMTPAVDSAYGEMTLLSTEPAIEEGEKVIRVTERNGIIRGAHLPGPGNPLKPHDPRMRAPLDVYLDYEAGAAVVDTGGGPIVLVPGQWSEFTTVTFEPFPMGMMAAGGIVRFYLRSIEPEFELYASPVNVDPHAPLSPVSFPDDAAADLADDIGPYYTQGMAEDVNALKKGALTDEEFMQQATLVYEERGEMLDVALDRYLANDEGGVLFFYYSSVDLAGHMMWRHSDPDHPHHDPEFAARDSSHWTGREGTRWKSVIKDLYVKMDPVLGKIRNRVGEDTLILVMSDHGFAPYRRKFSLNTWLLEEGYLVLKEGAEREAPEGTQEAGKVYVALAVDWEKTRAFGMGFNGLYLNQEGRESQGIVSPGAEAEALLREIKMKLEGLRDSERGGTPVVLSADLASEVYQGERLSESPDIVVGYNSGYGNSDQASEGRIPHAVLSDNLGGTFNGSHLMDPSVVSGILITNGEVELADPRLEDLTAEILKRYDVRPSPGMVGRPVLRR